MSGAGLPPPGTYLPYTLPLYQTLVEPLLVGSLLSFTFFGVGLVQFYLCFSKIRLDSSQDRVVFWFLVLLFCLDIVDTIGKGLFIGDHLKNIITGGLMGSAILPKTAFFLIATETPITCVNHAVYVYRIVRLTPNRGIITYGVLALSIATSIAHVVGAVKTAYWIPKPLQSWVPTGMIPWASIWLGGAAAADLLLCLLFVGCLARHRTDFSNTNDVITRWIGLSLETGILPSALQIATLAVCVKYQDKPYEISIALFQPKVYVNAILIIFNTIITNRNAGTAHSGIASGGSRSFPDYSPNQSKRAPYPSTASHGGMPMNHLGSNAGSRGPASQIVVTSEVYRTPDHVDLVDQQSEYEKGGFGNGHAYAGNYR